MLKQAPGHSTGSPQELERRPGGREARREAERAMLDLGPDISALDALLDELAIPSRELGSPGAPTQRTRPSVPPSSLRSRTLPQSDEHSHPSSMAPSISSYVQPDAGNPRPGTLSPPLRSSSFPTPRGLSARTSAASLGLSTHQSSSQYLSSTPPDPESDIPYLRPPSVASFATTNSSSHHHSPVPAPLPPTSTEETMEQTAAMINQLYARLDVQGVPGDGWEQGRERSRDGLISPEIVAGGQTIGRGFRVLTMRESVLLPPSEVQVLKRVDRYGFFSSLSALASQHNRIATLRTEPLSVYPGESKKKATTPAPAQSTAMLAHRASTASLLPVLSTVDLEREQRRISKWSDMLSVATRDEGGNTRLWAVDPAWWVGRTTGGGKYANLQRRVMKGIPDRWRGAVWGLMLEKMATETSAGQHLPSLDDLEADYRRLLDFPSESDVQIDLDVPRTISGHIQFHTRYGQGQRALFHVLHALGLHCDDIGGYCQGMGPIAATLLCYFEPQRTFASLVRLFDQYKLSQIFAPGFPGLLESFYVQERIVELLMPEVHQAFTTHFISSSAYATKWYITLFANSVPFSTQLRLWDGFFLEGVAFLELTAVAIIWSFRDAFASPDAEFESILSTLTSFFLCDSDDALMRWIRKAMRRKDLREKMEGWRLEWRGFVADGSSASRTT